MRSFFRPLALLAALFVVWPSVAPLSAQTPPPEATPLPPAARKKLEKQRKFDTNGDGKLDDSELAAMKAAKAAKRAERLKKYDADGDGKLNDTELAKLKADRAAKHEEKAKRKAAAAAAAASPTPPAR